MARGSGHVTEMKRISILLLVLVARVISAQNDSIYALPEVEVAANRDPFYDGWAGNMQLDTGNVPSIFSRSVAEVPFLQIPAFNAYGPGRLATLGVRGASGKQLAVYWEDIPIQSPMIGLADLSLIGNSSGMRIRLSQGVWSAGKGIGSSAGALSLEELLPDSAKGITINAATRVGSYGEYGLSGGLDWNCKRFNSRLTVDYLTAKNNYPYEHFGEERSLSNAANRQAQAKWIFHLKLRGSQFLEGGTWFMTYQRGIPPTRLQRQSLAQESGGAIRNYLRHRLALGRTDLTTLVAYVEEGFSYEDKLIDLDQTNRSRMLFLKQKAVLLGDIWWVKGSWEWQYAKAFSPNYPLDATISRAAAQVDASAQIGAWKTDLTFRQELSDALFGRPIINFRLSRNTSYGISIYSGIGSFFRWPAMDDLYWVPGGNRQLDPEYGWQTEGGILYKNTELSVVDWSCSMTAFYRRQSDAIQWYPDGQIWTVSNLGILESYGLILQGGMHRAWGNTAFELNTNIQLTRSDELTDQDDLQQIYVPIVAGLMDLKLISGKWKMETVHQYRSKRYFLNSPESYLPGVLLHHVYLSRMLLLKNRKVSIQGSVQNLLGKDHEWVIDRPMPGRTFHLSVKIH